MWEGTWKIIFLAWEPLSDAKVGVRVPIHPE